MVHPLRFLLLLPTFLLLASISLPLAKCERIQELTKLKQAAVNGVISFNFTGYQHFVLMDGRNYDLVILYTGTKKSCPSCEASSKNFEVMAKNYYNQLEPNKHIFFGYLYVDRVENVVGIHKLRFLPAIIYIDSTKQFVTSSLSFNRENQWRIPEQKDISSVAMIKFLNSRTGNNFEIILSFEEKVKRISMLVFFLIVSILCIYNIIMLARNKPFIIMILAVIACSISMSGLVYSIQHGKYQSRDFFAPNPRVQNLHEGMLMSILMTLSSLFLFLTPFVIYGKVSVFKMKIPGWSALLLLVSFVCSVLSIYLGYKMKVSWYAPTFYPPQGYLKGPLLVDRGNSF
ncbi:signal peptide-containing protein [Cryptosporidium canis]|uniref:Signal peptide-containing protein n=1 Tax=Cryptosporidium canis TaxID=195482 RepID=A0A9D5HV11_9CRYT|nr:signal peptide-containing protein [Cryptosporidium canis]